MYINGVSVVLITGGQAYTGTNYLSLGTPGCGGCNGALIQVFFILSMSLLLI